MLTQLTVQDIIDTSTTDKCDGKSYIIRKKDIVNVFGEDYKILPEDLQVYHTKYGGDKTYSISILNIKHVNDETYQLPI